MGQVSPNMEYLEMTTMALVKLLEAQSALSDIVPATGYISRLKKESTASVEVFKIHFWTHFRLLTSMNQADGDVQKPGVLIINELAR